MHLQNIPRHNGTLEEAYRRALAVTEPMFVPTSYFADDRGFSLLNQLQNVLSPKGQINYSTQYPGVIKAWHRHKKQTDFWICLRGHLKVGVCRDSDNEAWIQVIGEKQPGTVIIPPTLWHAVATVGHEPGGLLYFVTEQYNPANPDEERVAHDHFTGFPWGQQHA